MLRRVHPVLRSGEDLDSLQQSRPSPMTPTPPPQDAKALLVNSNPL